MSITEKISDFLASVFSAALVLVALFIPINPSASAWAMFLAFCAWLSAGRWSQRLPERKTLSRALPILLFYGLALLGLAWSTAPASGWDVLRVQLSLFLVPLMLLSRPKGSLLRHQYRRIVRAFLAGNLLAMLLSLLRAALRFYQTGNPDVFSYGELVSWLNLHPAYSTFYAGLGVLLLFSEIKRSERIQASAWSLFTALVVYLFLLNSRGTLLAFLVAFSGYILWRWWFNGQRQRFARTLSWVLLLGVTISLGLPQNRERMYSMTKTKEISVQEGTASLRLEIWKGAWQTLRQEPFSGYGTGSVRENLVDTYEEMHFQTGVDAAFNAHNQYLQTWLMLGLPGLLLLLITMVQIGIDSWRNNRPERIAAIVFLGMAMMSEAMLERQMGVLPFAFFVALWVIFPSSDYWMLDQGKDSGSDLTTAIQNPLPGSNPLKKVAG
ncbi:MAG: hypothetical protein GC205_01755 [Bacteroidetes bacterium]|nr:hypothetical protein [Bacteroidota bacterium]